MSDRSFDGYVKVSEVLGQGMMTLRADLSDAKSKKAVKDATGQAMPKQGHVAVDGMSGAAWMSPDEALVMTPHADLVAAQEKALQALGTSHALLVDVSDARAVFQLEGDAVREVLAKLSPADLHPSALSVGQVRRTRLAQVAGAFWLTDETNATVVCFRSVGDYVFALLKDAASIGAEVNA